MTQHNEPTPPASNFNPDAARISCRRSTELVSLLRDTPLSERDQQKLHLHINTCTRCRVASRQFSQLFEALDELLNPKI